MISRGIGFARSTSPAWISPARLRVCIATSMRPPTSSRRVRQALSKRKTSPELILNSVEVEHGNSGNVTQFLIDWSQGDPEALENLIPLVYNELRRLARSKLRRLEQNPT